MNGDGVRVDFGGGADVAFWRQGCAGLIRLTRPHALNCLNQSMTVAITHAFEAWVDDEDVALVMIEGEGRSFCAGGDVVSLWHKLVKGADVRAFFCSEYRLNSLIGHFPKPCISFLDGFVMGGGAGLSMHGSHRIATQNTLFAMPESAIGFFPDVGMASLLAKLEGNFGLYLALSGEQIRWGDCYQLGLATHAIKSPAWPALRQQLIETGDINILDAASEDIDFETSPDNRALIDKCFGAVDVAEIMACLTGQIKKQDDFATRAAHSLQSRSPTSLKVIHKHMALVQPMNLDECLKLDYSLACHMLELPDFCEGVRARLIDKDNQPKWHPSRLDEVRQDKVDACFMSGSCELDL